jgi:hypothetical protein
LKLSIPPRYRDGFAALLSFDDSRLRELSESIATSEPASSLQRLTERLAERSEIEADELADVLDALASLYGLFADADAEKQELISDLCDALARDKAEDPRLDPDVGNWAGVESFFGAVLQPGSPLALTAKAAVLRGDVGALFCTAKTLSDLRPVFRSEGEPPAALLPLHTLQIAYHLPSFDLATFSVTMTAHHLFELRDVIARAIRKHEQLRSFARSSDIPFLDDEES